ncbi:VOC family protein [Chloroflexota bacterium]
MIRRLDHIGVAVRNLEQVKDLCTSVFKVDFPQPRIGSGDFKASWVQIGNITIEFMEPVAKDGIIAKFLKRHGEGIQHICFEVDDIESEVEAYEANGIEVIEPKLRGKPGWRTAFFHPKCTLGILIELVQTIITQTKRERDHG